MVGVFRAKGFNVVWHLARQHQDARSLLLNGLNTKMTWPLQADCAWKQSCALHTGQHSRRVQENSCLAYVLCPHSILPRIQSKMDHSWPLKRDDVEIGNSVHLYLLTGRIGRPTEWENGKSRGRGKMSTALEQVKWVLYKFNWFSDFLQAMSTSRFEAGRRR